MSRKDYEDLLKATDRAINFLVAWKRVYTERGKCLCLDQPDLIGKADSTIAAFAEYRFAIKRLLRGEDTPSLEDQLRLTMQEIDNATNPDTKQLYLNRLREQLNGIVTDGALRGVDV